MDQNIPEDQLFSDFLSVNKKEWIEKVKADFKEESIDPLVWHSPEGFEINPFYTKEDLQKLTYLKKFQNSFLNVKDQAYGARKWINYESIHVTEEKMGNETGLEALNAGADGLLFSFDHELPDLEILLKNIKAEYCHLSFRANVQPLSLISSYINDFGKKNINGFLHWDPIADWTLSGQFSKDSFSELARIIALTAPFPGFYGLTIESNHMHNTGAGVVQELAFVLNKTVDYLDRLTNTGLSPGDIFANITLCIPAGNNYFMEIAKLRALRFLFYQLARAYEINFAPEKLMIHSTSSRWNRTLCDPDVNMLRNASEATIAIIGGCNSLATDPHDNIYAKPSGFSKRIARNISNILKEESYLDKVADPSAGSYYIESLTDQLIKHSWSLFQKIEGKGGFIKAFESGLIQSEITSTKVEKMERLACRKDVIVGTNQYPTQKDAIEAAFPEAQGKITEQEHSYPLLKFVRRSQAFETIRYHTKKYIAENIKSSKVNAYTVPLGQSSIQKARQSFSAVFMNIGGFNIAAGDSFEAVESSVEKSLNEEADIIIICGSDEDYLARAKEFVQKFRARNKDKILLLAGMPTKIKDELKDTGLDDFIHLNSNVIETISRIQGKLGITDRKEVSAE